MFRSHILARELRGALVVLLTIALIFWLFSRLVDDRREAQATSAALVTTTTEAQRTTTTTLVVVDDTERLCSLSAAFREDLRSIRVELVNQAGDPLSNPGDRVIDIGLHPNGDIPEEVRRLNTVAGAAAEASGASVPPTRAPDVTTTTEDPGPRRVPSPAIVDPNSIDPLESGLLGEPQNLALNFYLAAAALRLGLIDADFDGSAEYFADLVRIGEPARWDLDELAASELNDRWLALTTRSNFGVENTLSFIEEACSIRIGSGFVYQEKPPDLPILEAIEVPGEIDPGRGSFDGVSG